MAGTPLHHVGATARLPWTATAVTPAANLAALRYGRTARCHDRGGLVPRGGRSRTPAESGRDRSIVSGGRSTPRVARWGVLGRVVIGGPTTGRQEPGTDSARGPRGAAWRGPRSRQDRGHKRPHPTRTNPEAARHQAALDPRQHQIVW